LKKIIKLANGALELTILRDGAIVLAEIKRGYVGQKELKFELNAIGYSHGLIEQSINALEKGQSGQLILAIAFAQNEAAAIWRHSGEIINKNDIIKRINEENFNISEISFQVKKDERLLTITSTPKTILRYPDGRKKHLKELGIESVSKLCGDNTHLGIQSKSIISDIDGSMHSSIYGILSVFPEKSIRSIGKVHGKIFEENALLIEQDIMPESYVETPSNISVNGFIKSSIVEAGGNIICQYGIDNTHKLDTSSVTAGQSVITAYINRYPVWAGSYLLVNKKIEDSLVQCLGTIATPLISASEVRVGEKLYVKDIVKGSEIFLGNSFVENEELTSRKSFHLQHKKRLVDLEETVISGQSEVESSRNKVITQIKKLRKVAQNSFGSDIVLNRFFTTLTDGMNKIKKKIHDYENTLNLFEKEQMELSFFEQQLTDDTQPEIVVLGKIEPGTVITTINQELKVSDELNNVSIKLDKTRGILNIQPFLVK